MRNRLLWKLLGANLPSIAAVIVIVWFAVDYMAADYLMALMQKYDVSPVDTHAMFLDAVHRYLIVATVVAVVVAIILSVVLTRRVLDPLEEMAAVAREIAAGRYDVRASVSSTDEVGEVAAAFNQMAENLQRIEHLRRQMVADVAHELRTPLTNIRGYLEALRDGLVSPDPETWESLHEETMRLAELVEDLLDLARAEAAGMSLELGSVDVRSLVETEVERFRPRFRSGELDLAVDVAEDAGSVQADGDKIARALGNLLENASQHTPAGGTVTVAASREGSHVTLAVSNTGSHIAEHDLPHIFERFYRGGKSRARGAGDAEGRGGAGIGLAIVKELVEAHGGTVGAESDEQGTCVWMRLGGDGAPRPRSAQASGTGEALRRANSMPPSTA